MIALVKPDNQIDALPLGVVVHGDALAVLKTMADNSVDACVVDPPYGLGEVKDIAGLLGAWLRDEDDSPYIGKSGFMGKDWDAGVPGPRYWREVYRVLKPGAHILCFAGTRTVDLMTLALRLAGFQCKDMLMWLHGQGFPKSTDISKKLDKMAGAERKVIGFSNRHGGGTNDKYAQDEWTRNNAATMGMYETAPATSEAAEWNGWGTALKPAHEPIILARKPLAEPSIAANVLKYGTGGINVDASRISGTVPQVTQGASSHIYGNGKGFAPEGHQLSQPHPQGRWPANLLLSHSLWCVPNGTKRVRVNDKAHDRHNGPDTYGFTTPHITTGYADPDGMEEVEDWQCAEDCPIRLLDEQSGVRKSVRSFRGDHADMRGNNYNRSNGARLAGTNTERGYDDVGGSSRYFTNLPPDVPFLYTSKSSRRERNAGCEGLPEQRVARMGHGHDEPDERTQSFISQPQANTHPTVKSLALMRWLVRLVTPPDGIVLDPFAGSGSTLVACVYEGFHFIGIEQKDTEDEPYCQIAEARIAHARREV